MLWAKIVSGVIGAGKKIISNIKNRKIAKLDARALKSEKKRASVLALGEGGSVEKPLGKIGSLVFDQDEKEERDDTSYNQSKAAIAERGTLMGQIKTFFRENWKLAVPGAIGLGIVLVGMIYKAIKKR